MALNFQNKGNLSEKNYLINKNIAAYSYCFKKNCKFFGQFLANLEMNRFSRC